MIRARRWRYGEKSKMYELSMNDVVIGMMMKSFE